MWSVTTCIAAFGPCEQHLERVMKRNSKLMEFARKFLPVMHGRFQEMCSLAATGQLGGPQMSELNEHVAACDSCRKFLESVAQVSIQVMPVLAEGRVSAAEMPPQGMRTRFLSRLAVEELSARDGVTRGPVPMLVQKPAFELPGGQCEEKPPTEDSRSEGRWGWSSLLWRPATILVACAVIGIIGFYVGHRTSTQTAQLVTQLHPSGVPSLRENPADDSDRMSFLEQQKKNLESRLRETDEKLNASETQEKVLSEKLDDASNKLTALTAETQDERARLTEEDQQAKSQV